MKNLTSLLGLVSLVLIFSTGCSIFGHKDEPKASNEVVDAGMVSQEPVKVSEGTQVIDAGVYREKEDYSDIALHGGKNGGVIPTEKFYALDREKRAPVGRVLYVLSDDSPAHCMLGKYTMFEGRKKLVVYSKSPVPTNYCIYQKPFSSEPEGFSIYVTDGGKCRPSFTEVTVDSSKRKMASVEKVDNTVSMTYCLDGTVSYGQELAHRKQR